VSTRPPRPPTARQQSGTAAEERARAHLEAAGLRLLARQYRVARGPGRHAGEVDLVMQERDGTVVFVEVRARSTILYGGAAASVGHAKRDRLRLAARHYLGRFRTLPPCRFDVVAVDGDELVWLRAAFDDAP
jgi:putative endonuclease